LLNKLALPFPLDRPEMKKHDSLSTNIVVVGNEVDRYPDVFNLLSHVDDLEPEDLFQVS
jgi:hypothetical protein